MTLFGTSFQAQSESMPSNLFDLLVTPTTNITKLLPKWASNEYWELYLKHVRGHIARVARFIFYRDRNIIPPSAALDAEKYQQFKQEMRQRAEAGTLTARQIINQVKKLYLKEGIQIDEFAIPGTAYSNMMPTAYSNMMPTAAQSMPWVNQPEIMHPTGSSDTLFLNNIGRVVVATRKGVSFAIHFTVNSRNNSRRWPSTQVDMEWLQTSDEVVVVTDDANALQSILTQIQRKHLTHLNPSISWLFPYYLIQSQSNDKSIQYARNAIEESSLKTNSIKLPIELQFLKRMSLCMGYKYYVEQTYSELYREFILGATSQLQNQLFKNFVRSLIYLGYVGKLLSMAEHDRRLQAVVLLTIESQVMVEAGLQACGYSITTQF